MRPQDEMIERLRQICRQDERVVSAMLYGSFAQQEADAFSDIDCVLFFDDTRLPEVDELAWVQQIRPVELFYTNEFGNRVAIFDNLVRAEFHFDPASTMPIVETWRGAAGSFASVQGALLVDRSGELARYLQALVEPPPPRDTAESVQFVCNSFLNWMLFGVNVLARGERARALELLVTIRNYLLRMARIGEGTTRHWVAPTKGLEREISEEAYARFAACTATVDEEALRAAYVAAWRWARELLPAVAQAQSVPLPQALIEKLDGYIARYLGV